MAHALETLERLVFEFVNQQHFRVCWMKHCSSGFGSLQQCAVHPGGRRRNGGGRLRDQSKKSVLFVKVIVVFLPNTKLKTLFIEKVVRLKEVQRKNCSSPHFGAIASPSPIVKMF